MMGTSTLIPNSFKMYQRRRRRIEDHPNLWMDDVYLNFDHKDTETSLLEYHSDNIQWLDLFRSSIWWTKGPLCAIALKAPHGNN